jgi:hypothetical protein
MTLAVMVMPVTALPRRLECADVTGNRPPMATLVGLKRRVAGQREVQARPPGADSRARTRERDRRRGSTVDARGRKPKPRTDHVVLRAG